MKTYHVYLPTESHDPCRIGTIEQKQGSNVVSFKEEGEPERIYGSVIAAIVDISQRFNGVYLEEV